jgi:hypothetical protein
MLISLTMSSQNSLRSSGVVAEPVEAVDAICNWMHVSNGDTVYVFNPKEAKVLLSVAKMYVFCKEDSVRKEQALKRCEYSFDQLEKSYNKGEQELSAKNKIIGFKDNDISILKKEVKIGSIKFYVGCGLAGLMTIVAVLK